MVLVEIISSTFYAFGALGILSIIVIETYLCKRKTGFYAFMFNSLTMTVYNMYLLQIILSSLVILTFNNSFGCTYISTIIIGIHFPCRGIYFSIFIVRIYIIFKKSPLLNYSVKLLITLFFTVLIFAILLTFGYIYDHITNAYYDPKTARCISGIPFWLLGVTAIYDLSFNILTLYLFIKKLRNLTLEAKTYGASKEETDELQSVIFKSTVLVIVSVSTSFILAAIYAPLLRIGLGGVIIIDWIINSLCIALMKRDYDKYYQILCFYPNQCIN
eukprot:212174_1